jgi:hypothetical protein
MKLGKRSKGEAPVDASAADAQAGAAAETWTPADDRAASPEPPTETWTPADSRAAGAEPVAETEAVVEGEAVELTGAATEPEPAARPVPLTISHAQPVSDPPAPAANPIVDVSGAPGTTAPSYDGHAAEPPADPLQPVRALAAERPEIVVGAAFAGGVLAAMILRRLGN